MHGEDLSMDPIDPRDGHAEALEFRAAVDELKQLPPLLQEVVVMHSQTSRHQDVADLMGLSRQRVAQMLIQVAQRSRSSTRSDLRMSVPSPRRGPRACESWRTLPRNG